MTDGFPPLMKKLIDAFTRMPGIGAHSAQRLTFYILQSSDEEVQTLVKRINEVKKSIAFCSECNNLSENDKCSICSDASRDRSRICVVGTPKSVIAMEKSGVYRGLYHVLLGDLSPIDGVGPDEIKVKELIERVRKGVVQEVIIATDFTTEGETTALYLEKVLRPLKIKVSRLARGVPAGAVVEQADMATLQRALEERR
jgi:recombination protein RecR